MTKNNVLEFAGRDAISDPLTALLRSGAQQLITQAVEAELQELLSQHSERRTDGGHAVVVRNGHLPERDLQTGLGPVTVRIPKVRSTTGAPVTLSCPPITVPRNS
jgi:putative transposase